MGMTVPIMGMGGGCGYGIGPILISAKDATRPITAGLLCGCEGWWAAGAAGDGSDVERGGDCSSGYGCLDWSGGGVGEGVVAPDCEASSGSGSMFEEVEGNTGPGSWGCF